MKKKVLKVGTLGFFIGVFIAVLIPIIISYIIGTGSYYPIVPDFINQCGSEINAATIQYLLSGIMGFGIAASSVIYTIEKLSILKQSAIHFAILSLSILPVAYICHWTEHSIVGIVKYFLVYIVIYIIIWIIEYFFWKRKIKKLNEKLSMN